MSITDELKPPARRRGKIAKLNIDPLVQLDFEAEGKQRGTTGEKLMLVVIEEVVRARLYAAVLDF